MTCKKPRFQESNNETESVFQSELRIRWGGHWRMERLITRGRTIIIASQSALLINNKWGERERGREGLREFSSGIFNMCIARHGSNTGAPLLQLYIIRCLIRGHSRCSNQWISITNGAQHERRQWELKLGKFQHVYRMTWVQHPGNCLTALHCKMFNLSSDRVVTNYMLPDTREHCESTLWEILTGVSHDVGPNSKTQATSIQVFIRRCPISNLCLDVIVT